jgi:nicotinamide mononucleotide transporter
MIDYPLTVLWTQTSLLEMIAVACGLASVWFMKKENILVYPLGIVNVLIYIFICYRSGLYAYSGINVFYAVMSGYGWVNWLRKDPHENQIHISRLRISSAVLYAGLILIFFISIWFLLRRYTDSRVPGWDGFTTAVYIVAMWLLAYKKIEHWFLWIAGDVISVGLFAWLGLYLSAFQFLVFTVIAVLGFFEWRKKLADSN